MTGNPREPRLQLRGGPLASCSVKVTEATVASGQLDVPCAGGAYRPNGERTAATDTPIWTWQEAP